MAMSSQQEKLEALLSDTERYERRARQRALLFSLIPILLAVILLGFTFWRIQAAQDELANVQVKLADTQKTLGETTLEYAQTQNNLSQVRGELTDSQGELVDANGNLAQIQSELDAANARIADTQKQLDATTLELEKAQEALLDTQGQVEELDVRLEGLQQDIAFAEEQLAQYQEAGTFRPYLCTISPERAKDWPLGYNRDFSEQQMGVFFSLLQLQSQGVKFSIRGNSIEEGFNSPNFAVYVLQENNLLPSDYDPAKRPWEQLPHITEPGQGDLVYYKSGYTMFYFVDEGNPCVIGMTPAGILSLKPEFSEIVGYLDTFIP